MRHVARNRRFVISSLAVVSTLCALVATPFGAASASVASSTVSRTDAAGIVWLCRPGIAGDPCTSSLRTTSIPASGARTTSAPVPAASAPFDCFYVYPTVSTELSDNADLSVQRAEVAVAINQVSPFSTLCRVWAPMYRQRTIFSLLSGLGSDPAANNVAYRSVLAAWGDYLTHYNDGRPIIFIGHSQGAAMLIRLLSSQVDPSTQLRARTVSAIIVGGNVTVPTGRDVGSTFQHLPLCTSNIETSCVIAFSTFPRLPPSNSDFGRPGQGISLQSGQTTRTGEQVACVNPANLSNGPGTLEPYFLTKTTSPPPPAVTTPWVTYPNLYGASCHNSGGASWLQVTTTPKTRGTRPVVTETLGPAWGFHLDDINLTLGNLVHDVAQQEQAFTANKK